MSALLLSSFIVIVQLIVTFAGAVVRNIVVLAITAIALGAPIIIAITSGAVLLLTVIATSVVAIAPLCHHPHCFGSLFCVPWRPIGRIGSNQGTSVLTMMYGWSACPWMCQTVAESVNKMTSMSIMSSCLKYYGCEQLRWEVPYPMKSSINSYVKFFLVAKTTPTTAFCDVDDGSNTP
jgi:hypothetical protein